MSKLQVGTVILIEGRRHIVVTFTAKAVQLADDHGGRSWHGLHDLLDPTSTFTVCNGTTAGVPREAQPELLDLLDEKLRARVVERSRHMRQVQTGFLDPPGDRCDDELPDPRYDPAVSISKRVKAKADELGVNVNTVWKWLKAFRRHPVRGFVPDHLLAAPKRIDKYDPRFIDALDAEIGRAVDGANKTKKNRRAEVRRRLDRRHGSGVVFVPSQATFNRLWNERTDGQGLEGRTKTRQGNVRRRTSYVGISYDRFGEIVVIDETPLDGYAWDPVTGEWVAVSLPWAMEASSRTIVAARCIPTTSKGVDAGLVIRDALLPSVLPERAARTARWIYSGLPQKLVTGLLGGAPLERLAGIPKGRIEAVVPDNARIFKSSAFNAACEVHGIDNIPARLISPTDKGILERGFRSAALSLFQRLSGYKGSDVWSRGRHPENEPTGWVSDYDDLITEWIAAVYQQQPNDNLRMDPVLGRRLCPNEAAERAIMATGYQWVPESENVYYDFLPREWVKKIHHDGIRIFGLRHDDRALNGYRNERSEYGGHHPGDYPIRHDPRDLSCVYIKLEGRWHKINWRGARRGYRPFTDLQLAYAKQQLGATYGRTRDPEVLELVLNDILDRWEDLVFQRTEMPMMKRALIQQAQQRRDAGAQPPAVNGHIIAEPPEADEQPYDEGDEPDEWKLAS